MAPPFRRSAALSAFRPCCSIQNGIADTARAGCGQAADGARASHPNPALGGKPMSGSISLKERLRRPEPLLATFCIIPSVEIVELIALAEFDAVILDMEHGPYGTESLVPLIAAARARNIHPITRVRRDRKSVV